ncbi:precorrin-2 dehydrogenase/sirohydrochlorin ferrochelatase family protein [Geofilum rubicundum]|uniref:precorrin-2 dehydrogenase n=1 Tax=Geofilum rubicundum JCM 15548 TaxID=1236989 RepID=A0A0E9LVM9_9BACT|nr:bifunctional precorrin-2 dehydrogenase/sirohydrochlorin ferrochelatase [Geofilum rubicundum]GAO29637.1 siroheme synthase [Geofilum rubicundum JCM 15548]
MSFLPVCLQIENEQILIIGGGKVALHKIEGLERFTRNIKVVAPEVVEGIRQRSWIEVDQKGYAPADLEGHLLVFAATDDPELNAQIKSDSLSHRCLVNLVDNPAKGDFASPAIFKHNNMAVAVSSNGENVHASVQWRNEIRSLVEDGTIKAIHH